MQMQQRSVGKAVADFESEPAAAQIDTNVTTLYHCRHFSITISATAAHAFPSGDDFPHVLHFRKIVVDRKHHIFLQILPTLPDDDFFRKVYPDGAVDTGACKREVQ